MNISIPNGSNYKTIPKYSKRRMKVKGENIWAKRDTTYSPNDTTGTLPQSPKPAYDFSNTVGTKTTAYHNPVQLLP